MGIYMDYWLIAFVSFVSFDSGHFASTPFLEHLWGSSAKFKALHVAVAWWISIGLDRRIWPGAWLQDCLLKDRDYLKYCKTDVLEKKGFTRSPRDMERERVCTSFGWCFSCDIFHALVYHFICGDACWRFLSEDAKISTAPAQGNVAKGLHDTWDVWGTLFSQSTNHDIRSMLTNQTTKTTYFDFRTFDHFFAGLTLVESRAGRKLGDATNPLPLAANLLDANEVTPPIHCWW